MRRWFLVSAGVVAVLLAGVGVWFAQRSEGDTAVVVASCPDAVAPTDQGAPAATANPNKSGIAAPDGGDLRVVESGFTQMDDGRYVSLGAVVENSSNRVAFHTRVGFRLSTAEDEPVLVVGEGHRIEIPIIHPGQRVVIGTVLGLDPKPRLRPGGSNPVVAEAGVDLAQTRWVPAEGTASYPTVITTLDPTYPPSRNAGTFRLRTNSNACGDLVPRGATLIYRDGSDKIVGGSFSNDRHPEQCLRGDQETTLRPFYDPPPTADMNRVEAAVLCDVTGATPKVTDPSPPVN
ncbi:hypothetical protein [Actinoplanes sp. NPDC049802]|uniref:hypothetical protein n=1 Tax=Actinoplanes sp. NPDC049802 TaxID=3154742 RepID=UPI0033E102DC